MGYRARQGGSLRANVVKRFETRQLILVELLSGLSSTNSARLQRQALNVALGPSRTSSMAGWQLDD